MTTTDPTNLGEILRRMQLVSPAEIETAVEAQRETPGALIGDALVGTGAVSSARVNEALELQRGLRSKDAGKRARAAERLLQRALDVSAAPAG